MSMIKCDRCSSLIDTDEHPEAHEPESDQWICDGCRAKELAYWKSEYDAAPLSERNPAEYRRQMIEAGRGYLLPPED